jgi:hypothetical protein
VAVSAPTVSAAYSYNGDSLRTSATTNGVAQHFVWDQATDELLSDGTNDYIYGPNGMVVEQVARAGSVPTFLHQDQLGSTRLLRSSTGAAVGTASYSPPGGLVSSTGPAARSATPAVTRMQPGSPISSIVTTTRRRHSS